MSWPVRLTAAAESDLRRAREWYQQEAPHIVARFRSEVRETHRRISHNPWQYPDVYRGVRRALVHHFPFSIFFRFQVDVAQVIAITHQARDPDLWKRRF